MAAKKLRLTWSSSPGPAFLSPSEVHLFSISLCQASKRVRELRGVLSPDEEGRRARIRRRQEQDAFCISHGFLRLILGRYTGTPPDRVEFAFGACGKPALRERERNDRVAFNLSHSGSIALVALGVGRQIGVDVQELGAARSVGDIASVFSPDEQRSIEALSGEAKIASFYACWVRKEAAVKALGGSIASLSREVIVTANPDEPPQLLRMAGDGDLADWHLHDLPLEHGYAAAVCYSGKPAKLSCWRPDS